jgi:hypothetical protein
MDLVIQQLQVIVILIQICVEELTTIYSNANGLLHNCSILTVY